jgi:hypothetical protein
LGAALSLGADLGLSAALGLGAVFFRFAGTTWSDSWNNNGCLGSVYALDRA